MKATIKSAKTGARLGNVVHSATKGAWYATNIKAGTYKTLRLAVGGLRRRGYVVEIVNNL